MVILLCIPTTIFDLVRSGVRQGREGGYFCGSRSAKQAVKAMALELLIARRTDGLEGPAPYSSERKSRVKMGVAK